MRRATTFCEYIWIDGTSPTQKLRSKTKIIDMEHMPGSANEFPNWGFDGSSTGQASGNKSDCMLVPVYFREDPLRTTEDDTHFLVMCEVMNADGTPHASNQRAKLRAVLDSGAEKAEPWFGFEQEYVFTKNGKALGWPEDGEPGPQGPYYCGVGDDQVAGREIVEEHMRLCVAADMHIEGINFEVLLGQAEFQIGAADPLTISDELWLARWLLQRVGEDYGVSVSWHPKPILGDWNGSGMHTNVSTKAMRLVFTKQMKYSAGRKAEGYVTPIPVDADEDFDEDVSSLLRGDLRGMDAIKASCEKFRARVPEHIAVYGGDNVLRLTGKHETCDINTFRYGVADRGASIRIPQHVANQGFGYFEDRRPAANADPYQVCAVILKTICDLW